MASAPTALPVKGDVIAGKYLVEGTIGTGGMGAVFEVSHRVTGKKFAVKWLLPSLSSESDAVKRFIREAQVAGRVDHPHVVEVYDVGQEGDSFFMVMELLQGQSLADRLEQVVKLPAAEACRIIIQVARGVAAAHAAGIIHRDLKPDNIYLSRGSHGEEVPKVLDFGISKMSNLAGEVTSSITRAGMVMGTPHYMAPEQVRAKAVDGRTDVYALGVILYEMLAGALPFPGDTYSDLVLRIMTETPKPLGALVPQTAPALVQVIERAMARDPAARYENVVDLAKALQPFSDGTRYEMMGSKSGGRNSPVPSATGPRPQTPLSTESRRVRTDGHTEAEPGKKTGLFMGLAALAAAAVLGLGWLAWSMSQKPRAVEQAAAPDTGTAPPLAAASKPPATQPSAAGVEPAAVAAPGEPGGPANKAAQAGDSPVLNTVRVAPEEPTAARAWQPPPGSNEAPRPVTDPSVPPTAAPSAPEPVAAEPVTPASGTHKHAHKPVQASPTASSDTPKPAAPSPAKSDAPHVSHRTLGLSMDDF